MTPTSKLQHIIDTAIERGFDIQTFIESLTDISLMVNNLEFEIYVLEDYPYVLSHLLFEPTHALAKALWGKDAFAYKGYLRNLLEYDSHIDWIDYIYETTQK